MSKVKKKRIDRSITTISKKDIQFEKILQFSGWIFLIAFSIFVAFWALFDVLLKRFDITINAMHYSYTIFTGTSAAFCFALVTKIRKNRDKKREIFIDWLIGEFLFCVFSIFAVAIYIW
jgi:uncharacterized membrane protein YoaK (UPF0700 family)